MANKPTQKEKEHRIAKVLKMLVDGYTKGEIKRECRERFDASARTVERYLQQARNLLIEELEEPIEAIKARSLTLYRSIINDRKATLLDKVRAQKRIDKIMGLEAPLKHEVSGRDGRPIQTQMIDPAKATKIAGDPAMAAHAEALGLTLGLPTGEITDDEGDSE
ncbi:MAG TPA: hypothetical protein DCM28_02785 [Phycisphaerales bacterium]|nr:hypothetical protein [Phycisphaerales bacterium]HCD34529.1 hypothetical protein [Phycisphaerales bacterium]|tara:strand:+ start:1576 stop:2067 length:492 start_codon:yes stop_codon:yes gene_type:complete